MDPDLSYPHVADPEAAFYSESCLKDFDLLYDDGHVDRDFLAVFADCFADWYGTAAMDVLSGPRDHYCSLYVCGNVREETVCDEVQRALIKIKPHERLFTFSSAGSKAVLFREKMTSIGFKSEPVGGILINSMSICHEQLKRKLYNRFRCIGDQIWKTITL